MAGATGIEPISTVLETAILTVVLRPFLFNLAFSTSLNKLFFHFITKPTQNIEIMLK